MGSPAEAPQRLSKIVAARVPCSRSEAERYITGGFVRVDGEPVLLPQARVDVSQRVEIDTRAPLQPQAAVTLLLHKPAGVPARTLVPKEAPRGLIELLPLPLPASGLSIHSNDRRIVRKLTEDAKLVEQELVADVAGTPGPAGLAPLNAGLRRAGTALPPMRVSWQNEGRLRFALKGVDLDAIPWACAQVGLQLTALKRIRVGRVPMAKLPPGECQPLPEGWQF